MTTLFDSVFASAGVTSSLAVSQFMICIVAALLIGAFFAGVYSYKSRYSKSFIMTLFLLPAIVAAVIIMVNGNVGAGVAVAGAFSLVRFRSVPGTAKEIAAIFMAMVAGLICGMGYIGYAVVFSLVLGICMVVFSASHIGEGSENERLLRITIPEDLNYTEVFDEEMAKYTAEHELLSVKTTNMGSMYKLGYKVKLRDEKEEKTFMDALRCKNGNLEIAMMKSQEAENEL